VDRRAFLGTAGAVAGAGLLAACSGTRQQPVAATRTPTATTSPPPPTTPAPSRTPATVAAPDWAALARGLSGSLLRPGQVDYDGARRLFDPRYDAVRPAAVVVANNAADVAECVRFAARYRIPVTARGGGHSYGGYSTGKGLVVNLSRMSTVDTSGAVAAVGAGTNLITLYAALAGRNAGVPAGSCPTVGVAGSTMGGGIGVVARGFGLTCDSLVGATVVTADGKVRPVGAGRDPDLFWALRGGGGGNFGIATSFSQAERVIPAWLSWVASGPDELWSNLHLDATAGGVPTVRATITYLGDDAAMDRQVDRLAGMAGEPTSRSGSTAGWLDTMKVMAGCADQSLVSCANYSRQSWAGSSDVVAKPLSAAGARTLLAAIGRYPGSISVIMDSLGGAVGRVAPTATAFWHRAALCTVQYYATLPSGAGSPAVRDRYSGLAALRAAMRPYTTGGAYVNYLDPTIKGWEQVYYGGNYPRLRQIKAKYDPQRVFDFPLAIH
jgi:FAD binding domain/Berberine and berberine like